MHSKIIWSPEALEDLTRIRDFIARDSEIYAAGMIERILFAIERLSEFPHLGRVVPELDDPALREQIVHPYRIIYRVRKESIDVAAIVHGARELPNALG